VAGPGPDDELVIPLEAFYRTPRSEGEREHMLAPNQLLAQILLPPAEETLSATYEIAHGAGPDYPLASASVALEFEAGIVRQAVIVLGQVAPVPWYSSSAAKAIIGLPVTEETARQAGEAGVAHATPLSDNGYKVQLAKVAIERALLRAVGLPTGGFE
jgi:xanthine dehydrogenase YagS FAD-binding subunit